jgi:hypothetical protein
MKTFRLSAVLIGLASMVFAHSRTASADEWDKTTKVTFNEPVQVPGKVLDPGTYVFRLMASQSNRHIVQIFNEDHTLLVTTVLAIPDYRTQPADKTVLTYDERPVNEPVALAEWFYPGDNSGQEFVYPKPKAEELSRLNHKQVPSESEEANAGNQNQQPTPSTAQNETTPPPGAENPPAQNENPPATQPNPTPAPTTARVQANPTPAPTPAPQSSAPQPTPQPHREMPQTASFLPLVGLAGVTFLGLALLLRVAVRA